jgi:hypothetical protein
MWCERAVAAGAAEVGELEEVAQLGGRQALVDRLEGVACEVASPRALLPQEDVGEVEAHGVEADLPKPVSSAKDRQPAVDGRRARAGLRPLLREPPDLKRCHVERPLRPEFIFPDLRVPFHSPFSNPL